MQFYFVASLVLVILKTAGAISIPWAVALLPLGIIPGVVVALAAMIFVFLIVAALTTWIVFFILGLIEIVASCWFRVSCRIKLWLARRRLKRRVRSLIRRHLNA